MDNGDIGREDKIGVPDSDDEADDEDWDLNETVDVDLSEKDDPE